MLLTARRIAVRTALTLIIVVTLALGASAIITCLTAPPAPLPGTLRIYRPTQSRLSWYLRVVGDTVTRRQSPLPVSVPCGPAPTTLPYTPQPADRVPTHPNGLTFARHPNPTGLVAAHYFSPPPTSEQVDVAMLPTSATTWLAERSTSSRAHPRPFWRNRS